MDELRNLYYKCFNEDGSIKPCGRQNCINLIVACKNIRRGSFGDENTGYMNTDNIKKLVKELGVVE